LATPRDWIAFRNLPEFTRTDAVYRLVEALVARPSMLATPLLGRRRMGNVGALVRLPSGREVCM
jgi:hypothetical protein